MGFSALQMPIELYSSPLGGKTTDRRAGCGRSASPVRREGRRKPMRRPYPYVRLRAGAIRGVEVPSSGDARSRVAKGNCAAARWGGEQPEAKMQSVG